MSKRPAGEIAQRFTSDIQAIQQQIDFQRRKSSVSVYEIQQHNEKLEEFGLPQLPTRQFLGLPPHELHEHETSELVQHTKKLLPKIARTADAVFERSCEILEAMDSRAHWSNGDEQDARLDQLSSEWTQWFLQSRREALLQEDFEAIISDAERSASESPDGQPLSATDLRLCLEEALRRAMLEELNARGAVLYELQERFEEIQIIADSGEPTSPIGLMRQAFISMMASFDAAIFDLVRMALRNDFFQLMPKLEKKLTIARLSDVRSWDEVRDVAIEDQLRSRYVKAWLDVLNNQWKAFGESFPHYPRAVEQINRRNIHLHHRGVVDELYAAEFNLDKLKLGEIAVISEAYWNDARTINDELVRDVAIWVSKLGAPNSEAS